MFGQPAFDLFEAVYTTRSMRRLKPDPVPPELIVRIIEAATMGPSGSNRQPWFFIVVRDRTTKAFVAERYIKVWERYYTPKMREVVATAPQSAEGRTIRSAKYLAEHIIEVPVMIFCCVKKYTDPARAGQPMFGAIFPAIQNLCLAARAHGLGTSLTTMHTAFLSELNPYLGVPPEYSNAALIPLGYPKGRWGRPERKPALEVMFWEKWGAGSETVPRE